MDSSYDVVIIGGGLAGITAALELLDHHQKILLLDRSTPDRLGGLARWAMGGLFYVDSPFQRKAGFQDCPERALKDWISFAEFEPGDELPRQWAEQYVSRCTPEVYEWLKPKGVRYIPSVQWLERGWHQAGNSVPRFHVVWGTGQGLVDTLLNHLHKHPNRRQLTLAFQQDVTDLLGDHNRVSGVRGKNLNTQEPFEVEAHTVIIAAGGITGDVDLVKRHWHHDLGAPPPTLLTGSHRVANGDIHQIAERLDARVTHLDKQWNYAAGVHHPDADHPAHGLSLVPPKTAVWVDHRGDRIGPEPLITGFDTRFLVEQIARQEKGYSWQILNHKIALKELGVSGSKYNDAMRERNTLGFIRNILFGNKNLVETLVNRCQDVVIADSLEELVRKMNALTGSEEIEINRLKASVQTFDEALTGKRDDPQVQKITELLRYRGDKLRTIRNQPILAPKAGPLIAIREFILTRKSLGGIQTDLNSQVLTVGGSPIEGLYAVGEAAGFGGGGIHGKRALEGTFLGNCIFNARVAVKHMVGESPKAKVGM